MSLTIDLPANAFAGLVVNTAPPTPASACRVDPSTVRLLKRVAEGSSGSVWVANWNGARVRAKILHHYGVDNLRFESRMTGLSHPNLVSVFGVASHADGPMLLTDHSDGETLREWMADNVLHSWRHTQLRTRALACIVRRLHIALQVAGGMAHLHANKIVHRDLKPDNVLVRLLSCGHPEAKVTDFGLSRDIDDSTGRAMTSTNTVRGTPSYMSPEQWRRGSVTHKADVYAYGLLVLELFTGKELTWTGLPPEFEELKGREQAKRSWYKWLRRACLEGHVPVLPDAPDAPGDLVNADGFPTVVRDVVVAALGLDPDTRPTFEAICDTLRAAADTFEAELAASDARDAAEFLGSTHTIGVGGWLSGDLLLSSAPRGETVAVGTPGRNGSGGGGSSTRSRGGSKAGVGSAGVSAAPPSPAPGSGSGEGFTSPMPRPPTARRRAATGSPAAAQRAHGVDGNPEVVGGQGNAHAHTHAPPPSPSTASCSRAPRHGASSPRCTSALGPHAHNETSSSATSTPVAVGHLRRMVGCSPGAHCATTTLPPSLTAVVSPRTLTSPRRWAVGGAELKEGVVVVEARGRCGPLDGAAGQAVPMGDWPSTL